MIMKINSKGLFTPSLFSLPRSYNFIKFEKIKFIQLYNYVNQMKNARGYNEYIQVGLILSNLEKTTLYRDSVGNRIWSVASRAINFIKINFNSQKKSDTILFYRIGRVWRVPSSARISLNILLPVPDICASKEIFLSVSR